MAHQLITINDLALQTANLNVSEPTLQLVPEVLVERFVLVGKIQGKKAFNYKTIRDSLIRSWRTRNDFEVTIDPSGVCVISFQTSEDLEMVWSGRPWCISNYLLVVQKWPPELSLDAIDFTTSPFWIRVTGLPANQITNHNANKIGSLFEELLGYELNMVRGRTAHGTIRLQVLLNLGNPLRRGFSLPMQYGETKWIPFTYERLPEFCYRCGIIGHFAQSCKAVVGVPTQQVYGPDLRVGYISLVPPVHRPIGRGPVPTRVAEITTVHAGGGTEAILPPDNRGGLVQRSAINRQAATLSEDKKAAGFLEPAFEIPKVGLNVCQTVGKDKKLKGKLCEKMPDEGMAVCLTETPHLGIGPAFSDGPAGLGTQLPKPTHHPTTLKACIMEETLKTTKPKIQHPESYQKIHLDPYIFGCNPHFLPGPNSKSILCSAKILEELGMLHLFIPNSLDASNEPSLQIQSEKQEDKTTPNADNPNPVPRFIPTARIVDGIGRSIHNYRADQLSRRIRLKARARQVSTVTITEVVGENDPVHRAAVVHGADEKEKMVPKAKRNREEEEDVNNAKKNCVVQDMEEVEGASLIGPQFHK